MLKSRRIHHLVAGGLVIAAAAGVPAAAQARPATDPPAPPATVAAVIPPVTAQDGGSGFRWADAAIGAGGATLLLGAGVALTDGTRRRRAHPPVIG